MGYVIQKLSLNDLPKIIQLVHTSLTNDFPEYQPRAALIYKKRIYNKKYFQKFLKKKGNAAFGAFNNSNLIGYCAIKADDGGVIYIDWLVVDNKYRNQGIGSTLLKQAEKWGLKHYYHYIYLHTESQKNINYYKKRGFDYIGTHRRFWFGVDEHLMQKLLQDKPFEEMFKKYLKE